MLVIEAGDPGDHCRTHWSNLIQERSTNVSPYPFDSSRDSGCLGFVDGVLKGRI